MSCRNCRRFAEPLPEWEYHRAYQMRLGDGPAETVLLHLPPDSVDPEL